MEQQITRRRLLARVAGAIGAAAFPIQETGASENIENNSPIEQGEVIDNLLTFGHQKPLMQDGMLHVVDRLNVEQAPEAFDTYYATMFASEKVYNTFNQTHSESFQSFLKRHEAEFNGLLSSASEQTNTQASKVAIRRLIVLDNNTPAPDSFIIDRILYDSDGGWNFTDRNNPDALYVPENGDYIGEDPRNKNHLIDYGLLHEWGHSLLSLPDEYTLDFSPDKDILPGKLLYVTPQWQSYLASHRADISNDLMSVVLPSISLHTVLQLHRRLQNGGVRSKEVYKLEAGPVFPSDIPDKITLQFGEAFAGSEVTAYVSTFKDDQDYSTKRLTEKDLFVTDEKGAISLTKEFFPQPDNNLYGAAQGVYFFEAVDKTGKHFYRWMDIRDLNIAYWYGFEEEVLMQMNLADPIADYPDTFDWSIWYSLPE